MYNSSPTSAHYYSRNAWVVGRDASTRPSNLLKARARKSWSCGAHPVAMQPATTEEDIGKCATEGFTVLQQGVDNRKNLVSRLQLRYHHPPPWSAGFLSACAVWDRRESDGKLPENVKSQAQNPRTRASKKAITSSHTLFPRRRKHRAFNACIYTAEAHIPKLRFLHSLLHNKLYCL